MDLKFTFGGASPDHGDAPSGVPLPFSTSAPGPASTSGVLEIRVRRGEAAAVAEAVSGDGVTYGRAEVPVPDAGALPRAVRSAMARAVAELEGPLAGSVTAVVLELGPDAPAVLDELGVGDRVGEALQRRIGLAAETPVRAV